jgi:hypothetical protein
MDTSIYGVRTEKMFPIVAFALAIVLVHTQTATAFKETSTSYEDGFQRGVKDAGRGLQGLNGHGFDDSCPSGHTAVFCDGYKQGYSERWHDTSENDS